MSQNDMGSQRFHIRNGAPPSLGKALADQGFKFTGAYRTEGTMSEYVVEMRGISKSFGEVHAVREGEFTLKKGEIHSLIGENGAGKSTMMKLLYGMYPIDSGEFIIKERGSQSWIRELPLPEESVWFTRSSCW